MTLPLHLLIPQFQGFLVVMVRIAGILAALPMFGSRVIPNHVKVALIVGLAVTLLPFIDLPKIPTDGTATSLGMLSEFLVGLVIGLVVRTLFAGFELAGEVMGSQMGFGAAQLFDPTTAHQVSVIAQYQTMMASLIFLSLNGHMMIVQAAADSFRLIKPFGASLQTPLVDDIVHLSQGLFVVALKLAAPVIAVTLLVNLIMAMLGRAVSQLNVFILSYPITIACGLLVMGVALPGASGLYESEFIRLYDSLQGVMRMLGHE
jgi:flagellar biosynthetic protein FliR